MKVPYEATAIKRILDVIKSLQQIGEKKFVKTLTNKFGLEEKEAFDFIELIKTIDYFEPGYDTVLDKKYLKIVSDSKYKKMSSNKRKEQLIDERNEIRDTIKRFRKLPEELRKDAEKKWPDEYRKLIKKEIPKFTSPTEIAIKILSERWNYTTETIQKYIKSINYAKR